MEMTKLRSWKGILSLLSLLFGSMFYVVWSALYNAWTDISSYSVSVPFVMLGLLGILFTLLE